MMRFFISMIFLFMALPIFPIYADNAIGDVHKLTNIIINNDVSNGSISLEFADEDNVPEIQKIDQNFPERVLMVLPNSIISGDLRPGLFYQTLYTTTDYGIKKLYLSQFQNPPTVIVTLYLEKELFSKVENMNEHVAVLHISDQEIQERYGGKLIASEEGLKSPADRLDEIISTKVNEKLKAVSGDIDQQIKLLEETLDDLKRISLEKPSVSTKQGDRYRIQVGDKLDISIVGEPDFQRNVIVRPDGFISYPLLGDVVAEGLTPEELAMILKSRLMKAYFNYDLALSVTVIEYMPSQVYLLGNFAQAGPVEFRKGMTLLDILGRFDRNEVDLNNVSVIRKGKGKYDVNLTDVLKGDIEQNIELMPNDYIVLTSNEYVRIMVMGKVRLPGLYKIRSDSRIYDAIASAGGVSDRCDIRHVLILREKDGVPEKMEVNLRKFTEELDISQNLLLSDRDIIFVPEIDRVDWDRVLTVLQRAGSVIYDYHLLTR